MNKSFGDSFKLSLNNIPKNVFLIFLAISGNFLAQTLGCKFQKLLNDNMLIKYFTAFIMIYFTTALSVDYSPLIAFIMSFAVFIGFVMLVRTHLPVTVLIILLLIIIYTINNYVSYYENIISKETDDTKKEEYKNIIKKLELAKLILEISTGVILILGYFAYLIAKHKEYSKDKEGFSFINFTFGKVKCKSMV